MDFFTRLNGPTAQPTDSFPAPSLAQWERAVRQGGEAAIAGHAGVALRHTREALAIAQALLDDRMAASAASSVVDQPKSAEHMAEQNADHIVCALVVSHHNLADLYHAAHLHDQAAAHVCRAHATLMALLALPDEGGADTWLQQAALRHSRETHAGLLLFVREKGPHPNVLQALHDHADLASTCGLTRH